MRTHQLFLVLCFVAACNAGSSSNDGGVDATTIDANAILDAAPDAARAFTITLGAPSTFATHAQLAANGFTWGPSDGTMGAVVSDGGYDFFGSAKSAASCAASPTTQGAFRFTGTLDQLTGVAASQCKVLFPMGSAPAGWVFDKDYAGGGSVVPFQSGTTSGLLMSYHGEVHWTVDAGNGLCNNVPCFYGGIGLAVSVDGGITFESVGQIIQAYPPLSKYEGGTTNVGVGYGSFVVADAAGNWMPSPPTTPSSAYLYVVYEDYDSQVAGNCASGACTALARARFDDVLAAVLPVASSNPASVAALFHKYDSTASDPWSSIAHSGDPTENTPSGHFTPLFDDVHGYLPTVIWDKVANAFLMVHQRFVGGAQPTQFVVRSSPDLIHWSTPLATYAPATGHEPFYPTIVGETGDPLVGGAAPRLFFSSFNTFPNWASSELDVLSVQVTLQ